jgi:hypothetical protein
MIGLGIHDRIIKEGIVALQGIDVNHSENEGEKE